MIYFLFLLSIGLITGLAVVIKQLQHQRLENSIALQRLREAEQRSLEAEQRSLEAEQIRTDLITCEALVQQLQRQLENLQADRTEEIAIAQQRLKDAERKSLECEQLRNELVTQNELIQQLNQQIESLKNEQQELENLNQEQEKTIKKLYDDIDVEIKEQSRKCEEKIKELDSIRYQFKPEIQNPGTDSFIQLKVLEPDLYPQEKMGILIDILKDSQKNTHENSRRQHILDDIISNNESTIHREEIKNEIHSLFKDYKSLSSKMRQTLERMGFEMVSENNHYKIVFCRDPRYTFSFAKTPSDWRSGRNIARDICNVIF